MRRLRKLRPLSIFLRLLLAAIFLYASIGKIQHPADFASIVRDYNLLPASLTNLTAIILPWLEFVLGVLLLWGTWQEGTLLLVNLLLIIFWSALVCNYVRGVDISCGCFSTKASGASGMLWYLVRDGFFMLASLLAGILHIKNGKDFAIKQLLQSNQSQPGM